MRPLRVKRLISALLLSVVLGACGGADSTQTAQSPSEARERVVHLLRVIAERTEDSISPWRNLALLLPVVTYHSDGGDTHASDIAVLGNVTQVTPGGAFTVSASGYDEAVPFDSLEADGRWVIVTLDVVSQPCGEARDAPERVTFRLLVDRVEDLAAVDEGLQSMGELLVFLKMDGAPNGAFSLAEPGAPLTPVLEGGTLPFPGMARFFDKHWNAGITTLDDLRNACTTVDRNRRYGTNIPVK